MAKPGKIHENKVAKIDFPDRWGKMLLGGKKVPTMKGFTLGVGAYKTTKFGENQVHDDQEALYIISGKGEVRVAGKAIPVVPGMAIYLPKGCPHASRKTGKQPLKLVWAHSPA
jgi:mannose-6-phosphate isomerase-like protein (cupin superfamily)